MNVIAKVSAADTRALTIPKPVVAVGFVTVTWSFKRKPVTVQFVRQFDVLKRRMINRLDFLGGISAVRPEWACRISG